MACSGTAFLLLSFLSTLHDLCLIFRMLINLHSVSLRSVSILSSHLRPGLPSGLIQLHYYATLLREYKMATATVSSQYNSKRYVVAWLEHSRSSLPSKDFLSNDKKEISSLLLLCRSPLWARYSGHRDPPAVLPAYAQAKEHFPQTI
jgi:hypothetical protein